MSDDDENILDDRLRSFGKMLLLAAVVLGIAAAFQTQYFFGEDDFEEIRNHVNHGKFYEDEPNKKAVIEEQISDFKGYNNSVWSDIRFFGGLAAASLFLGVIALWLASRDYVKQAKLSSTDLGKGARFAYLAFIIVVFLVFSGMFIYIAFFSSADIKIKAMVGAGFLAILYFLNKLRRNWQGFVDEGRHM